MTGTRCLLCGNQVSEGKTDSKARLWAGSPMCTVSQGTKTSLLVPTVGLSQDEKARVLTKEATAFIDTANCSSSQLKSQVGGWANVN